MFKKSFFCLFVVCVMASCSPNNVKSDKNIDVLIEKAGMKGSFALMENGTEQFTIHNLSRYKDSAYAPLNSFFIVPALLAIDKGYMNQHANTWISFDSAGLYNNLIQKIGRQEVLKAMDSLHYGKGIVSNGPVGFWQDNSLLITADEQLGLIKKLYFSELFFNKRSQDIAKQMILKEDNANYKLSYIIATDTTQQNTTQQNVGWILGYVEENKHPYFFVLNTSANSGQGLANKNVQLLKSILLQQGFLKGRR